MKPGDLVLLRFSQTDLVIALRHLKQSAPTPLQN
jgi:hypothetical protein